jgi:hypothetical protein
MQADATLADVWPTLKNPKAYVQGVLINMWECGSKHHEAYLRLGITGKGLYPSYRVIFHQDGEEKVYNSYTDSHVPFTPPYDKVMPGDWSTKLMGFHEVIGLIGKL